MARSDLTAVASDSSDCVFARKLTVEIKMCPVVCYSVLFTNFERHREVHEYIETYLQKDLKFCKFSCFVTLKVGER
jgi:hypothetical protein